MKYRYLATHVNKVPVWTNSAHEASVLASRNFAVYDQETGFRLGGMPAEKKAPSFFEKIKAMLK